MNELEHVMNQWCHGGFGGTCIGSTVLGKFCFLIDMVITSREEVTAVCLPATQAAPSSPTMHLVGDHTIRSEPRTVNGFLRQRFADLKGDSVTQLLEALPVVTVYFARNEHSMSSEGFESITASLRSAEDLVGTPPCPRVGDVYLFPPSVCFSRNTDGCAFPTRQVLGKTIPVLNARDGVTVHSRGEPHRPADYADKWQVEKKARVSKHNAAKPQVPDVPRAAKFGPANTDGRTGHGARFRIVANWLVETFGLAIPDLSGPNFKAIHILDVAGGGGRLSCELALMGFHCTVVDPRSVDDKKLASVMELTIRQHSHHEAAQRYFARKNGGDMEESNNRDAQKRSRSDCDEHPTDGIEEAHENESQTTNTPSNEKAKDTKRKTEALGRITFCRSLFDKDEMDKSGTDFDSLVGSADIIVGLHCDGAVNAIVDAAAKFRKNFAIIPCCVFPSIFSRTLHVCPDGPCGHSEGGEDGNSNNEIIGVPVIDRGQLVHWILQETRRLGFKGKLLLCTPERLVGANECAFGIADPLTE